MNTTIQTIRNRILSRALICLVKLIWWWEDRKPLIQRLRSLAAPTSIIGGFIMCILSVYGQLRYPELIATIGVIAFLVGAWVILPPVERNRSKK